MLAGDVMLGRSLDQILPYPGAPEIFESYMRSALDYVSLAELRAGPIPRHVPFAYVWGEALAEIARLRPDLRIVNLETAATVRGSPEPKGINYRMTPANLPCLAAAGIDCCTLANNHVLDFGAQGLADTLDGLGRMGMAFAGAGRDEAEAQAPAILPLPGGGRVLVHAAATRSSGVPDGWAAGPGRLGVHLIDETSVEEADRLAARMAQARRPGDLTVLSVHWGGNWGYEVPPAQRAFARRLVAAGAADVIHGHSSHHFKGAEIYQGKAILYGCGDLINDYEGIGGHEEFRGALVLLYFLRLRAADGQLAGFEVAPFRLHRFRLSRIDAADARWIRRRIEATYAFPPGPVALPRIAEPDEA